MEDTIITVTTSSMIDIEPLKDSPSKIGGFLLFDGILDKRKLSWKRFMI